MTDHPHVLRVLDLSTAHLSVETRRLLDSLAGDVDAAFMVGATGHGWFVSVIDDTDEDYPADILACFALANTVDASHILFDRDASAIVELEVHDEDDDHV